MCIHAHNGERARNCFLPKLFLGGNHISNPWVFLEEHSNLRYPRRISYRNSWEISALSTGPILRNINASHPYIYAARHRCMISDRSSCRKTKENRYFLLQYEKKTIFNSQWSIRGHNLLELLKVPISFCRGVSSHACIWEKYMLAHIFISWAFWRGQNVTIWITPKLPLREYMELSNPRISHLRPKSNGM